ncbi:MAG: hypothetical protein DMG88_01825 [Acidobacteria bacterium]|nr:MAG: hypothetical protein DMG88_01825 [Acidobacteriota bacterium]
MSVMAFDEDQDESGNRDNLIASGTVEPSPDSLRCLGSRWVLHIDEQGVRHESDLRKNDERVFEEQFRRASALGCRGTQNNWPLTTGYCF